MDASWSGSDHEPRCRLPLGRSSAAATPTSTTGSTPTSAQARTPCLPWPDSSAACSNLLFWERHRHNLQQDTFQPKLRGPWLFYSGEGFGCETCKACGDQTSWGPGTVHAVRWQIHWRRRAASARHQAAVGRMQETNADVLHVSPPPSHDEFKKVLQETIANGATDICGIAGIGGRKKVRKIQYCLAESKRNIQRVVGKVILDDLGAGQARHAPLGAVARVHPRPHRSHRRPRPRSRLAQPHRG